MEAEIAELEKTGATELAGKLRESWKAHATAADTLKAEHAGAAKKLAAAERDLAKYKSDLEAASKGVDERVTKLAAERDEAKKLADQRTADLESYRLKAELGDRLGITDAKVRGRALDAFLADYRPEGAGFDATGKLQGFDAALEAFRRAEAFFFTAPEPGNGGGRAGSDPAPKAKADAKPTDKVSAWTETLYPTKTDSKGAKA